MVGSTIGPSCLTIFSLLPPSLPSQAGQMVGSTIGPSCLTSHPCFCLISSQAGQMVGSTIGLSCLAIFSLLPPSLPPKRARVVGSLPLGPSCLTIFSCFCLLFPPKRAKMVGFYHRSVLILQSFSLLPVLLFPPRGPAGCSTIGLSCLTLFSLSAFLLLPPKRCQMGLVLTIGPYLSSLLPLLFLPCLPPKRARWVVSTIGLFCLTLFSLFLPNLSSKQARWLVLP
ncbi:hypothetical protein DPMN_004642 [Dreissena polymorpha]|uniref:Uncharacterized protein n=1 Tax=Dreissena polymorpha TaxID=45954 RepID=A0A9D4MR64_DREPO|nr:hypothetical protein DPMN_004642 [Dreissena polymorpha]